VPFLCLRKFRCSPQACPATNMHAWLPIQDALDALLDMREYDVPYHMRFQIDTDVRCGHWYSVRAKVSTCACCNLMSKCKNHAICFNLTAGWPFAHTLSPRPRLGVCGRAVWVCTSHQCRPGKGWRGRLERSPKPAAGMILRLLEPKGACKGGPVTLCRGAR
jgi:DNA polymerase elongation subunit (family B)